MKMQNQSFHKEVDNKYNNDLDYISENCTICGEELIRVEDIFIGKKDDLYYCQECSDYNNIKVVKCRDI